MPTYDYECTKCGHKFEFFKSMSEPDPKRCPECKGKIKRLIGTGAGIIFKGSGFYETDYKKKKSKDGKTDSLKESSGKSTESKSDACKTCPNSKDGKCPETK